MTAKPISKTNMNLMKMIYMLLQKNQELEQKLELQSRFMRQLLKTQSYFLKLQQKNGRTNSNRHSATSI